MSVVDLFAMAIKSMLKRKIRTFLTVLGVVIGTAAITVMISLGVGVNQAFDTLLEEMGAEALRITIWADSWGATPLTPLLDEEAVAQIGQIPGVHLATPLLQQWWSFEVGRYQAQSLQVMAILPEAMPLMGFHTEVGGFNPADEGFQILLSANAYYQFQSARNRNPFNWNPWDMGGIRASIDLLERPLNLVGDEGNRRGRPISIQPVGMMDGEVWDTQHNAFMMLHQFQELEALIERRNREGSGNNLGGGSIIWGGSNQDREEFQQVIVIAENANQVSDIVAIINEMGFEQAWSSTQWIDMQRESTEMLQGLLAAIAGVSLMIAAISIANTMVMSIYERTREIGIMKVIGASIRDIRQLFLIEAGLIGAVGGLLGLGLSAVVSHLMNTGDLDFFNVNMGWGGTTGGGATSVIPLWLYGLSFTFASLIGLVSGFLPARRATKISALAAIKTD